MGKTHLLLALAGATLLVPAARATSVSASGGDGAFGVHADTALLPTLHADADYLRTGSDRGDAKVYGLGLSIAPPTPLLHWSIGARYQYQRTRWGDGGGVQVGASLFVDTPIPLLTVGGYGYYLPPGAAHGRVRHASDYGAQLRLGLTRSIYAWAGYRYMRTSFEGFGTQTLYKGPSLGVSVGF
ncbi:YfaZ family outer membrane protein [Fulvimonas sp. R45]|uniref:YfaZ family outer membrane protein n=1 Tax=Fulvimonas sp. R45 TaxID=3045937 RepID=UPI00265EE5D3|nr:YfaZ family outer membrane protein [Fulvimonas sp. R45]MDO1529904.1 YfaZ family outer membrane protein [Fulvimonas sp. R45]